MKKVIFIAPPLAGKGTLSKQLSEENGYFHLSVGDVVRELLDSNPIIHEKIDNGELLDDDTINHMIKKYFDYDKIVFDGYPRTVNQAEYLLNNADMSQFKIIFLDVDKNVLLDRVLGRRQCENCHRIFNLLVDKVKDICPICSGKLYQRSDDSKEVFDKRYDEYLKETYPLIKYYKDKGMLIEIKPPVDREELYQQVLKLLGEE